MDELFQYRKLAKYYDLIYSDKDYRGEAREITRILAKYKRAKGKRLLDVACGTGEHLRYLSKRFSCTGTDLNREMLAVARKKLPGVRFIQRDMADLRLREKFDVITCLFSSIGYLRTAPLLQRALNGFYDALDEGGVAIIDGWLTGGQWKDKSVHMHTYGRKGLEIATVGYSTRKGKLSRFEAHYLIGEVGKGVSYVRDAHRLRLTESSEFLALMRRAGFRTIVFKGAFGGRNRYLGIKVRGETLPAQSGKF